MALGQIQYRHPEMEDWTIQANALSLFLWYVLKDRVGDIPLLLNCQQILPTSVDCVTKAWFDLSSL